MRPYTFHTKFCFCRNRSVSQFVLFKDPLVIGDNGGKAGLPFSLYRLTIAKLDTSLRGQCAQGTSAPHPEPRKR
jgi:hypothetical protein